MKSYVDNDTKVIVASALGAAALVLFTAWNGFFWPIHLGMALLVVSASLAGAAIWVLITSTVALRQPRTASA